MTTTYAFIRPNVSTRNSDIVFTSTDPSEVAQRWQRADVSELPLRVLRDGKVHHPTAAEAQAVFAAKS